MSLVFGDGKDERSISTIKSIINTEENNKILVPFPVIIERTSKTGIRYHVLKNDDMHELKDVKCNKSWFTSIRRKIFTDRNTDLIKKSRKNFEDSIKNYNGTAWVAAPADHLKFYMQNFLNLYRELTYHVFLVKDPNDQYSGKLKNRHSITDIASHVAIVCGEEYVDSHRSGYDNMLKDLNGIRDLEYLEVKNKKKNEDAVMGSHEAFGISDMFDKWVEKGIEFCKDPHDRATNGRNTPKKNKPLPLLVQVRRKLELLLQKKQIFGEYCFSIYIVHMLKDLMQFDLSDDMYEELLSCAKKRRTNTTYLFKTYN